MDEVKATTGVDIKTVMADAGYASAKVYCALDRRRHRALIPAKAEPIRSRVPMHGEAKSWHGLARAIRRGIANMRIQAYLTAAAINLKITCRIFRTFGSDGFFIE